MSRIGRLPVPVPAGVDIKVTGSHVKVKGPKGEMSHTFPAAITIEMDGNELKVQRPTDQREHRALHGMTRALINNMVVGVSEGFSRELEIQGVGYRAELNGKNLILNVGYSHPVEIEPPAGIEFAVENRGRDLKISGYDKQAIGQLAANIRKVRPPEPYKGKGIRYKGEFIRLKAGKSGKA
jgi:large subunit ribosomal protein L6